MSLKSASTLVEVPGVINAVDHLQELAYRMQNEEFGFDEKDIDNIDRIIEALNDARAECEKLHEKLETETIKASVLRHTLQFLPDKIKSEMKGAVNAARESNAEELNRLQTTLQNILDNTNNLQKRHAELDKENSVLHPERDQVREQHGDIISQLNQRMAEKASKQITLNETKDKLRETNQKIVDLEEGILQLKEDLTQDRADARMEKKRLKKAVYDTTIKTREQKDVNIVKKKELDILSEKLFESESRLDEMRKSIRRYETSRARLEGQERALSSQLQKDTKTNEELGKKGEDLGKELVEQVQAYEQLKEQLEEEVKGLKKELKYGEKKKKKQTHYKGKLEKEVAEKQAIREEDEERVAEQNRILQEAKQDLAWKAEEVARLRQENIDMEQRIEELGETHEAIVATFQKQIEELRDTLSKERKERMQLQGQRDTVQKEVDDYQVDTKKYLNDINKKINTGKQQHDELTHEGTQLQKTIREEENMIRSLQDQVSRAKTELEDFRTKQVNSVNRMETEIVDMEVRKKDTKDTILAKTPSFIELEKFYEERSDDYDKTKRDVVSHKNKKLGLEDAVKNAKRDVDKLVKPTEKLREDLTEKRGESLEQLKKQALERTDIEKQIYTTGSKLRTAMEENHKFNTQNDNLEYQMGATDRDMDDTDKIMAQLEAEINRLKGELVQQWAADNDIQKDFASRDQSLVEDLGQLLEKTSKREHVISGITNNLQSELLMLAKFLDNVAKRRPKESAKPRKKSAILTPHSISAVDAGAAVDSVAHANTDRQPDNNRQGADHNRQGADHNRQIADPANVTLTVRSTHGTPRSHNPTPRSPKSPHSVRSGRNTPAEIRAASPSK